MEFKDKVDVAQKLFAIAAIIAAGWWFLIRGEGLPRADIKHDFYSACLNQNIRWVRAIVTIENVGEVRVSLSDSDHRISQVFPVERKLAAALANGESIGSKPGRIDWPDIARVSTISTTEFLEPGESYTQYRDFLIPGNIKVAQVTSFYKNASVSRNDKDVGWFAIALHDVGEKLCD